MAEAFDPYYRWLGIPPGEKPVNHYRLLGLELFESERDVIDAAANRQMSYLKDLAIEDQTGASQRLLNELAQARICLLNAETKAAYDQQLQADIDAATPPAPAPPKHAAALPPVAATPVIAVDPAQQPSPDHSKSRSFPRLPVLLASGAAVLLLSAAALVLLFRGGDPPREDLPVAGGSGGSAALAADREDTGGEPDTDRGPDRSETNPLDPPASADAPEPAADPAVRPEPGASPRADGAPSAVAVAEPPDHAAPADSSPDSTASPAESPSGFYLIELTGRDSRIVIPDTRRVASANREFTAELWVKIQPGTDRLDLMGTFLPRGSRPDYPGASGWDVSLLVSRSNCLGLSLRFGGAAEQAGSSRSGYGRMQAAGWHHVAVVKNRQGEIAGYIDGQPIWKTEWAGGEDPELSDLRIGGIPGSRFLRGLEGQVRGFRLSSICRYDEAFRVPGQFGFALDADTVALLDFDQPRRRAVRDLSRDGIPSELINARWLRSDGAELAAVFPPESQEAVAGEASPTVPSPSAAGEFAAGSSPAAPPSPAPSPSPAPPDSMDDSRVAVSPPAAEEKPQPAAVAAVAAPARIAVPPEGERRAAEDKLREIYGDRLQQTQVLREKVILAGELKKLAEETSEAAARYVLFEQALELAVEAPHFWLAIEVADALAADFKVDAWDARLDALKQILQKARTPSDAVQFTEAVLQLIGEAADAEDYDAALALHGLADTSAERTRDAEMRIAIRRKGEQLSDLRSQYELCNLAKEHLKSEADNPKANLAVGRYTALVQQRWQEGLPYLAKCDHPQLREAAEQDLADPADAASQLQLADKWWELAGLTEERERGQLLARADYWYRRALQGAAGLDQKLAQQRVEQIASEFPDLKRIAPPGSLASDADRAGLGDLAGGPQPAAKPAASLQAAEVVSTSVSSSPVPPASKMQLGSVVFALALSPDGKHLAAGLQTGVTAVWDLAAQRCTQQVAGHTTRLNRLAYSFDGKLLASCGYDGLVRVRDLNREKEVYSHPGSGSSSYNDVAFSPDGKWLAVIASTQRLDLCDAATGEVKRQVPGYFTGMAFSPDSEMLAVSHSNELRLLDLTSGDIRSTIAAGSNIRHVAFSPNGRTLATLDLAQSLGLWDVNAGGRTLMASERMPHAGLGFSENGRLLFAATGSQVKLLDGKTLKPKLALQMLITSGSTVRFNSAGLNAAAWTPDGSLVAAACGTEIFLWNLRRLGQRR